MHLERDFAAMLRKNPYPGRGIVLGQTPDGDRAVVVYFIMGRSENSRNRVFQTEGTGLRAEVFDAEKLEDPSLILYAPVRMAGERTVVSNGDQTDTICAYLAEGKTFQDALDTRSFEPDAPHYTPRISGLLEADGRYSLSIMKTIGGNPEGVCRFFYAYANPIPGQGHFIHTYQGEGNPLPSFAGEPLLVGVGDDIHDFARNIWESLHAENKIALFVRYISLRTGDFETVIFNKNGEE